MSGKPSLAQQSCEHTLRYAPGNTRDRTDTQGTSLVPREGIVPKHFGALTFFFSPHHRTVAQ
jgi:hypothetical protein